MEQTYNDLKNYDIRRLQLVEAEMLKDLREICEKNNIRYYLTSGTLLGAVRHKGFIPWDNDIDVEMPYEDWVRFVNLPQEAFGTKYFLQTCDTDENWYRAYARVRLNNTTMMYDYQMKFDIHHGIWLDIFPLVEINDGLELKFKRSLLIFAKVLNMRASYESAKAIHYEKTGKKKITKYDLVYMLLPKKLRKRLAKSITNYIYQAKNKRNFCHIWAYIGALTPKSFYEGDPATVEFEGEVYTTIPKYKNWLSARYGDYMTPPPEDQRGTHDGLIVDFDKNYTEYLR